VLVGAVIFVLWWFQPQALLFDQVVDEEFPTVAAEPEPAPAEPPPTTRRNPKRLTTRPDPEALDTPEPAADDEVDQPTGPQPLSSGGFESRNRYTVTGEATVYELEDGSRTLRLEPFESTNGPDLYVYLTTADHADDDDALAADFVDLGDLRGNIGSQNYPIPDDVDLDAYDTVVIWCERFTVAFGAADLAPTAE
jgi:hypothetical protein